MTTTSGSRRICVSGIQSAMLLGAFTVTAVALHVAARSTVLSVIAVGLIGLAVAAAVGIGMRRYGPPRPAIWWCVLGCTTAYTISTMIRLDGNPAASGYAVSLWADLITLGGELFAIVTVASYWLRLPSRRFDFDLLLDALLIALAGLLASWTTLISPALDAGTDGLLANAISIIFPAVDAMLLALLMHSFFVSTRNDAALRLIQLAGVLILVADVGFALDAAGRTHIPMALLIVPHLLAGGCAGAAALLPSMVHIDTLRPTHRERSRQRASAVAVILLVAALVPAIGADLSGVDRFVIAVLLGALLIGLLVRSERAIQRSNRSERNAQFQADHDKLTGLMNRQALIQKFGSDVRRDWSGGPVALLFVDLNGFKLVNDTLGHAAGDELIARCAGRIRKVVGPDALAARYGGDEFVVAVPFARRGAGIVADRIVHSLTEPFQLAAGPARISASIGIAHTESELTDSTLDQLIRDADAAMYLAKARTVGGYAFHEAVQALDHVIAPTLWQPPHDPVRN